MISGFVENKDTDKEKEKNSGPGKALSIAAYPIAAVAGGWVFRDQIYEESYASHDRKKGFEDIREKGLTRYKKIQNDKSLSPEEKWRQIKKNNETFNEERKSQFKKMGYTNVFKHAGTISPLARNNAIISAGTVTGIFLGAALVAANGPNIWNELFGSDDKDKGAAR